MSSSEARLSVGAVLAGRWQVQDFIGGSGTGEVYGVRDLHGASTFALKLFWPNALGQAELWSALQQTARTASGLGVEGIARAHDFGIDANCARPFLVAERVSWPSLADRVRLRGPLSLGEMATAFAVLARALDAAHAIGLVHGDLKPENVFVAPENSNWVRLSDFGVALIHSAFPCPPGWGGAVGWVSPEAADPHARPTPAMDVFALGLVTFFALTGGALHRAAREPTIDPAALWQELTTPIDSAALRARELGASLDPSFDAWFQRAVAPDPQTRFASVGEMASAFQAIARNLSTLQAEDAPGAEVSAVDQPSADRASSSKPLAVKASRRRPLFMAGAALIALIALGTVGLYQQRRHVDTVANVPAATTATPPELGMPSAESAPLEPEAPAAGVASAAPAVSVAPAVGSDAAAAAKLAAPTPAAMASAARPDKATLSSKPKAALTAAVAAAPRRPAASPSNSLGTPSKKKCGTVFLPCK